MATWAKWTAVLVSVLLLATTAIIMMHSRRLLAKEGGPLPAALEIKSIRGMR